MLKHYIKFAIRNFRSNKVIFAGSLATLCLGALCISLLFSYVHNEITMDDFHKDVEDIYMVTMKTSPKEEWVSPFKFDVQRYPEVENTTSMIFFDEEDAKLKYNDYTYTPKGIVVDSSFFKVFNFNLKIGDEKKVLKDVEAVVLSESFSKKIFGDKNPIGKKVYFETENDKSYHLVKGLIRIPSNSSLKFDYLIPRKTINYNRSELTFIRLKKEINQDVFNKKIKKSNQRKRSNLADSITEITSFKGLYFGLDYKLLKDYSFFESGNKKNIDILQIIILVILSISILNYSNLQIVNTTSVVKNMAISKVNGALKKHIFYQKLVENIIMLGISVLIITILYNLILPSFNTFVKVGLAPPVLKVILINTVILLLMISAGLIYPMIMVHKLSTLRNIKRNTQTVNQLKGNRVIIVVQYTFVFVLLMSAIIVHKQLSLMLHKDLGFEHKNIMKVKLMYPAPYKPEQKKRSVGNSMLERKKEQERLDYVYNQLRSFSSIEKISQGISPIEIIPSYNKWKLNNKNSKYTDVDVQMVTYNYLDVFDIKLLQGSFFEKIGSDRVFTNKVVLNEAALKYWNISDINESTLSERGMGMEFQILGVTENFNNKHLSTKPQPLVFCLFNSIYFDFFIKFHEQNVKEGVRQVETLFNEINPNQTFKYSFLSDDIATLYQKEKRLSTIYVFFTIIAMVISAIGLFTISLYDTQRRIKEIGVRKVNGATIKEILYMLNKDFIKWVLVAFVIACPVAYYSMSKWLENFAYKTALSWWVFALAGLFTLVIALVTVSWQSYRAATQNPVESLRDE